MCERFNIPDHVLHMSFNLLLNKKRRMHAFIKDWDILIRATEGSLYPWIKGLAC